MTLCGWLPATQHQLHQLERFLMSRIDELLSDVAEKLDHAADVITGELNKLQEQIKAGQPTEATISKLKTAAERIHTIVDHDLEPGGEAEEPEEPEEPGEG